MDYSGGIPIPDSLPSKEQTHTTNHHKEEDLLCKYCVRDKLEELEKRIK